MFLLNKCDVHSYNIRNKNYLRNFHVVFKGSKHLNLLALKFKMPLILLYVLIL